jgi:hypothetical protein
MSNFFYCLSAENIIPEQKVYKIFSSDNILCYLNENDIYIHKIIISTDDPDLYIKGFPSGTMYSDFTKIPENDFYYETDKIICLNTYHISDDVEFIIRFINKFNIRHINTIHQFERNSFSKLYIYYFKRDNLDNIKILIDHVFNISEIKYLSMVIITIIYKFNNERLYILITFI